MSVSRTLVGLLAAAVLAAAGWSADERAKTGETKRGPAKREAKTENPIKSLEDLNTPQDAILIISDDAKKALEGAPAGVLVTPERYQELRRLEEERALKRQSDATRPIAPAACTLKGTVDGNAASLEVRFQFATSRPKTRVAVGCQHGWPRSASLDGRLPTFIPDSGNEDGLVVEVGAAGDHVLTLGLAVPLAARGAKGRERGFELGLPRAAITRLEGVRVPAGISEVRVNTQNVAVKPVDQSSGETAEVLLGPADRLSFSWLEPAAGADRSPPLLAAESRVSVRLDEPRVVTEVELSLQALRGEAKQWEIWLPPDWIPEVKEPGPRDERIEQIDLPDARQPWLKVRLKKSSAAPLRVVFQVSQSRTGGRVPVGPFLVAGAFRQSGTIAVSASPGYRLTFHPDHGVSRREPGDDFARDDLVAVFTYSKLSAGAGPPQAARPLMAFDVEAVKGVVESKVEHTLHLTEGGWRVSSRLDITPVRTGLDALDVQVPADYPFDRSVGASPAELVDDHPVFDPRRQVLVIKLARRQTRPFSVTLPALYPLPATGQPFTPALPRPVQTLDRGAQVTVVVPEGLELVAPSSGGQAPEPGTRKLSWSSDRAPDRAEVSWRAYRPELRADSVLDLTFRNRRLVVRQQISLTSPELPLPNVRLRPPAAARDRLRVLEGGALGNDGIVAFDRPSKKARLLIEYTLPAAELTEPVAARAPLGSAVPGRLVAVPLVRVGNATRTETKVRVWAEAPTRVTPAGGSWDELACEVVPEKDSLPLLVLRSRRGDDPLYLRVADAPGTPAPPLIIPRALIQAKLLEDGGQRCRARFLLGHVNTGRIEIELPAPPAELRWEALLDGKELFPVPPDGAEEAAGKVLCFEVEPELYRKPVVLEIRYQLPPPSAGGATAFRCAVHPPTVRGDVFVDKVGWSIEVPARWVCFAPGADDRPEQSWEWRGGLLTPRPGVGPAELENWLGDTGPGRRPEGDRPDGAAGLVCWRTNLEPVAVIHFPRQGWLLVCSLLFLGAGLAVSFTSLPLVVVLGLAASVGLAFLIAAVGWPGTLPTVLYGCEPGAAVLGLIATAHAAAQFRHRRRRRFLPGFARVRLDSPAAQTGSSQRRKIEPSTVDAPAARDSSVSKKQVVQDT